MGREPTLICYAVVAAASAADMAAALPTWLHVLLLAVIAGALALVNRSLVTPVAAPRLPVAAPAEQGAPK